MRPRYSRTRYPSLSQKSASGWITLLWLIPILIALILIIVQAAIVQAAPEPTGACCNIITCCPPLGNCQITTSLECEFGYQGDALGILRFAVGQPAVPMCPIVI